MIPPGDISGLGRDALIRLLHLYSKRIQELEEHARKFEAVTQALRSRHEQEIRDLWKDIADLEDMIRRLTEEEGRKA